MDEIPGDIQIIKQPIFEPFQIYNKLVGKKADNQVNPIMKGEGKLSWKARMALWVRANVFIPDSRMFWIKPSVKFLCNWLKDNPIDAMVTTGPPHSMHLIGLGLKLKIDIPWLADFRDPWTKIDFYHELNLEKWADRKHRRLEQEVLDRANHVVVVGNQMKVDYKAMTKTPVSVVTNGFDPADIDLSKPVVMDKEFSIIHIGMLGKARSHPIFWQGLHELRKENPELAKNLVVRIYGLSDPVVKEQIAHFEDKSWIEFLPYLPHHEVIQVQRKSAVLLLSVNNVPSAKGIITGKIFEYLALSRPILCIGPVDGDAAAIVNKAGAGPVVDFDDLQGFKTAVNELFTQYQNGKLDVNSMGVDAYSRKALCGEIGKILDTISS